MNSLIRKKKAGFTIAEILIALAILVIVSGMVTVIFRATQQSFTNARAFQHVIDLARQTVLRIHSEIASIYIEYSGIVNFVGIDADGEKIKSNSQSDEIFFIIPLAGAVDGDICEVGYWQRDDGNFMRHLDTNPDFKFSTAESDSELGIVISNLNFSYYDGTEYLSSWDTRAGGNKEGVFPKAVKTSFTISDENNVSVKEFSTTVRIASSAR